MWYKCYIGVQFVVNNGSEVASFCKIINRYFNFNNFDVKSLKVSGTGN